MGVTSAILGIPMLARDQRTPFSDWWWTVDKLLLGAIMALMLGGVILSLAASPPVATRIGLDPFHFFGRHVLILLPSLMVLIGVSFLSPKQIRRLALLVFVVSILLIVATLAFGAEVKGSRRWITVVGVNIQASESAKPAFVVMAAWLFAESARRPEMPATFMAIVVLLMLVSLLVMEPDFGQTMLILMVWGALFFIAGMRMIWVAGLAGAAGAGLFGAYMFVPHVAGRIKRFMNPASGDTFQVDTAMEAFSNGGWFGLGPGEGIAKRSLPDSHTDFVFAVAAEEFGIILCLALVALFAFVVIRTLSRAYATEDGFARFGASGLAILFGVQAAINISVNLQLIPAKVMTLPFISYGGSSIVSLAYSGLFTEVMIDVVPSETLRSRSPVALARTGMTLATGTAIAFNLIRRLRPAVVVGFGGYPTLPPLLAARLAGVPGVIHDANAVLGRANRFLSRHVKAIATSLPGVLDRDPALAAKATTVGTPMRPAILAAARASYVAPELTAPFRVLVVGGSQGARVMADVVPGAIERLEPALWNRLVLTQQVREEDMGRVRAVYDRLKIKAELAPFFSDLPARLASNDVVVSR